MLTADGPCHKELRQKLPADAQDAFVPPPDAVALRALGEDAWAIAAGTLLQGKSK